MNIIGVRKYEAAPHEQITFSFQRSRPNLPVSLSVDALAVMSTPVCSARYRFTVL
jgi:hypothetical protein